MPSPAQSFLEAADAYVSFAGTIRRDQLDVPATEAWSVRDLVGHATRGVLTVKSTLEAPIDPTTHALRDAADYFSTAMATPGIHDAIVQRGRDAAPLVGEDAGAFALAALASVRPLVESTPLDREVQHFAGRLRLGEYLKTRIVELTLHTVDLQLALGAPVGFPPGPSQVTRDALLALVGRADPLAVACAISGRGRALGCNVLG